MLEGIDNVLDNLIKRGIRGIVLGPLWCAEVVKHPGEGSPYGPFHEEIYRESLRKNVGEKTIYTKWFHAFEPDLELYRRTRIKPYTRPPMEKNELDPYAQIIKTAKEKGMRILILYITATPSVVILPEGSTEIRDIAGNKMGFSCINDPELPEYTWAYLHDIYQHYPEIDGFAVDHIEFPSYTLAEVFTCFCDGCRAKASELGYSFERLRATAKKLYTCLSVIKSHDVQAILETRRGILDYFELLLRDTSFIDWIRFRMESTNSFATKVRSFIKEMNPKLEVNIDAVTTSFALPSAADFHSLRDICDSINPKLYITSDFWGWKGKITEYVKTLTGINPELSEEACLTLLYKIFGLDGLSEIKSLKELNEKPISYETLLSELNKATAWFGDKSRVRPWIRIDISAEELHNMLMAIKDANVGPPLIRMYDVAPDEKIETISRELNLS
jgi:hypothetical protein